MALRLPCDCGGRNARCPVCNGGGSVKLDTCPYDLITGDVQEFIAMCDWSKAGTMPVLAGARDQAYVFMEGRDYFAARVNEANREREQHGED